MIIRGLQQLSRQPGRRVLVVFSDGDDRTSHATLAAVEQAVRASDATLFMVALGRGVAQRRAQDRHRAAGRSQRRPRAFVDRADRLDEPFAEIIEELANQYLIGYESTNTKRDGAWREIKVELPDHRYAVRARQGYKRRPSNAHEQVHMQRLFCALGCALLLSGLHACRAGAPARAAAQFETRADVVLVDVTVSSGNGEPVRSDHRRLRAHRQRPAATVNTVQLSRRADRTRREPRAWPT